MCNLAQVFLATKHGVEAKNYENLGDAAKLKPLEVELKRLEDMSESIVQDFAFMRKREVRRRTRKPTYILLSYTTIYYYFQEEMRDTNESTNSRVLYFSIFSMCCLLGLATWQVGVDIMHNVMSVKLIVYCSFLTFDQLHIFQVLYLRKYFKSKKLIE